VKRRGRGQRATLVDLMDQSVQAQGFDSELWPEPCLAELRGWLAAMTWTCGSIIFGVPRHRSGGTGNG
jgi:hypothetical protein